METKRLVINDRERGSIAIADRFLLRLRGMLGRDFSWFDALLIRPCSQIHTLFMAYPIDALFVDRMGQVVMLAIDLKPWVPCKGTHKAHSVIELPAGKAEKWEIQVGDHISVQ